jgi:hypothetical protein
VKHFWAGYENDEIACWSVDDGWGGFVGWAHVKIPCLYLTKQDARKRFKDVRKVYISTTPTTPNKKPQPTE